MNKFAENLKTLMVDKKISRKEIAKQLGVTERAVYYWQSGQRECSFDVVIKIAALFNVTIGQLLGTEE